MKIIPLADRVLIKSVNESSSESSSGIYLPESEKKERPYIYEVVEVGPGTAEKPMTVKVGDKILSGQYSGDEVKVEGIDYKIVSTDYILAIIQD